MLNARPKTTLDHFGAAALENIKMNQEKGVITVYYDGA